MAAVEEERFIVLTCRGHPGPKTLPSHCKTHSRKLRRPDGWQQQSEGQKTFSEKKEQQLSSPCQQEKAQIEGDVTGHTK